MANQSAFEHNTIIIPAWYTEINRKEARAAILLSFKEGGEGLMLTAPSLSKEDTIAFLKQTLEHLEGGQGLIQLLN